MQPTAGRRTISLFMMTHIHSKPHSLSPAVADLFLVRSMRAQFGVFVLATALLIGCDTFESREYRITHARRGDTTRVQRILRNVAAETRIPRSAPTPYDSPTIALYRDSKVQLRASFSHGEIRVTLVRYDWPAPTAFTRADGLLVSALSSAFDGRFGPEPYYPGEVERTIVVY
jgi:hypothetical protein